MRKIIEAVEISEAGIRDYLGGTQERTPMNEKYTVFGVKCGEIISEDKFLMIIKKGIRKSISNYMKNGKVGGTPISDMRVSEYTLKSPFTFSGITDNEIKWRSERYRDAKKFYIENNKKPPLEKWWVKIHLYFRYGYIDFLKENSNEIKKEILSMVDGHPNIEIDVSTPSYDHFKKDRVAVVSVSMHISYDPDIEGK